AGDFTDRLNKLLDRALPGHDPGLVIALTSALRGVESAAPTKGTWDVAKFVAARPALADEVRGLAPHAMRWCVARPRRPAWSSSSCRRSSRCRSRPRRRRRCRPQARC